VEQVDVAVVRIHQDKIEAKWWAVMRVQISFATIALLFSAPVLADGTAKIQAVENGLLPAVIVKGEKPPQRRLEDRMRALHVPGVSIAIIDHGALDWAKAYGVVTVGTLQPVTPDTRFQAASISKTLNAATALGLVVEGKLALDEPVNAQLVGWQIPPSDKGYSPTLRALLSHSAGLGIHGFPGYAVGEPLPTIEQVLDGKPPANTKAIRVDLTPGKWSYSGGGTTISQKLIVDVSGNAYPDEVRTRVLDPVGMTQSTYRVPDAADQTFATAHQEDGKPIVGRWHIYPEQAAAGLWTTPSDLVKFGLAVSKAKNGDGKAGIDPKVAALLLERQKGLDTGGGESRGMGLGFFLNTQGMPASFSHGGANEGFRCYLVVYPEAGQGIAVMTNSDNGNALIDEIIRAVSAVYGWKDVEKPREITTIKPNAASLANFVGRYESKSAPDYILSIRIAGQHLVAHFPDGHEDVLLAESAKRFVDSENGASFVMSQQPGRLDIIRMSGSITTLQRKA